MKDEKIESGVFIRRASHDPDMVELYTITEPTMSDYRKYQVLLTSPISHKTIVWQEMNGAMVEEMSGNVTLADLDERKYELVFKSTNEKKER